MPVYSICVPSKSSFSPLSQSFFSPHPFYLTFKTVALHPLSLLLPIFSTVWTALCILNQLVFCFIMLIKHFLFSYVSAFFLHQLRENLEESISQLQTQRRGRSNGARSASTSASTLHTSDLEACSGSGMERRIRSCFQLSSHCCLSSG